MKLSIKALVNLVIVCAKFDAKNNLILLHFNDQNTMSPKSSFAFAVSVKKNLNVGNVNIFIESRFPNDITYRSS